MHMDLLLIIVRDDAGSDLHIELNRPIQLLQYIPWATVNNQPYEPLLRMNLPLLGEERAF